MHLTWECVVLSLKKTPYAYVPLEPSNLCIVTIQFDERFANRTPKKVVSVGVIRQTKSTWSIRANERTAAKVTGPITVLCRKPVDLRITQK